MKTKSNDHSQRDNYNKWTWKELTDRWTTLDLHFWLQSSYNCVKTTQKRMNTNYYAPNIRVTTINFKMREQGDFLFLKVFIDNSKK